jgi:choline dehydrogenase
MFLFLFLLLRQALAINLFTAGGQRGPLIGTYFGVPGANATFDYVIVGGGTAGLVLATRLSAHPNTSVAVIEGGGFYELDNHNYSVVPSYDVYYTGADPLNTQPGIDWGFVTTPQPALGNRTFHYPRGKTLGGSSARNYLLYHRGTSGSYQQWADQVGDDSYEFARFLPYFEKSVHVTAQAPAPFMNETYQQDLSVFSPTGGPLQVSSGKYQSLFTSYVALAFPAIGMQLIDGMNGGRLLGSAFGLSTEDPRNGHRSSSEASFLQTAFLNGTPPIIYKNILAQRILFNGTTAAGIEATMAGTYGTPSVNFTLSARKEVIVSGGAFQSPQLLMVSGIGNCSHLAEFNIPCVADLPGVGQNMWDQPILGTARRVNVQTGSALANNATLAALAVQSYLQNGSGPLSAAYNIYGWEKLPYPYRSALSDASLQSLTKFADDWPELEWLPQNGDAGYNLDRPYDPRDGFNYAELSIALVAPLSRGTVKLQSNRMEVHPAIDPAWLTDPTDVELAIQGFRRTRQAWQVLVELGIADADEALPGLNVTTDAQILDFIKQSIFTVYHASCTCKMGRASDRMAVVDSHAKVMGGISHLRVVDASAFPLLPPGHPQATVYALAEKIAADIMRDL